MSGIRDYLREEEMRDGPIMLYQRPERILDSELAADLGCSADEAADLRELAHHCEAQLNNAGDILPRAWRIKLLAAAIRDAVEARNNA